MSSFRNLYGSYIWSHLSGSSSNYINCKGFPV
jgi:hypothetical protein